MQFIKNILRLFIKGALLSSNSLFRHLLGGKSEKEPLLVWCFVLAILLPLIVFVAR